MWGGAMAAAALAGLHIRNGAQTADLGRILLLFFAGGLLSWPLAIVPARFLGYGRPVETRFAAFLLLLTFCTIAATALLFAIQYRLFYTQWHAPFGTRIWAYKFVFTSASAVYQFTVLGIRLYFPLGLPLLFAASLWLARLPSETTH